MRVALVDGDIVAFRCAASANNDPEEIALLRADQLMRDIGAACQADLTCTFISGHRNFRYDLYPEYKANRRESVDPVHRQATKNFLVTEWAALVSDGYEADDHIGITHAAFGGDTPIICSIDKDFKQLSGEFYNFVKNEFFHVDEVNAKRFFYKQLILGDKSDNIPGYDGKPRAKPTKEIQRYWDFLDGLDSELDMYLQVVDAFMAAGQTVDDVLLTAKLCYIWRKENDEWKPPTE